MNRTDLCAAPVDGVHGVISEAWSSGFMDGALVILGFFVITNMKRGKWLHKLVLLEVRLYNSPFVPVPDNGKF